MKIGLYKTVSGQHIICDIDDDNAPLLKFYNEFNNEVFAASVMNFICNNETEEVTK